MENDPTNTSERFTQSNNYVLENKTLKNICDEIFESVEHVCDNASKVSTICSKLTHYRLVHDPEDIHIGKHVRWLKKTDVGLLHPGGIVVNLRYSTDKGTYVMILNKYANRVMQYCFDECLTFQKLTQEETIIFMVNENYGSNSSGSEATF